MKNKEIEWLLTEKYQGVESAAFHADCARLAAGEPLAYLIGHTPFLHCTIFLDSHPLIPRPETEFWTDQAITTIIQKITLLLGGPTPKSNANASITYSSRHDLEPARGLASNLRVLDLCAGSGAIGVAVAKAIPEAHVTFAEIDPVHLPTIQKNLELNVPKSTIMYDSAEHGRFEVIDSDLFANIPAGHAFDFILTNPPYIDAAADTVDANVALHEPHLALFGGVAGIEIIARIIADARDYLTPQGQLWIEHEPAQVAAITALAAQHTFTCVTHPDQYKIPRVSVLSMAQ